MCVCAVVQANILFGRRWDPQLYALTIEACALQPDLDVLEQGDETVVGDRGASPDACLTAWLGTQQLLCCVSTDA